MKLLAIISTALAIVLGGLLFVEKMRTDQLNELVHQRNLTVVTLRSITDGLVRQSQISTDSLLLHLKDIEELHTGQLTSNVITTTHPNPEQRVWDYFGIELISDSARQLVSIYPYKP